MNKTKAWSILIFNLFLVAIWALIAYFCWIPGLICLAAHATVVFCTNLEDEWIEDLIDTFKED